MADADRPSVGRSLFEAALVGGAQALGAGAAGLRVGAPLDLVSLNPHQPPQIGRRGDALLDGWIFAGRAGVIDGVWRHGRKVVSDGRHVDATAIKARYRRSLLKVLAD
jgi:cytosine/adenosine deaminase-related metal-dependent hydrolase